MSLLFQTKKNHHYRIILARPLRVRLGCRRSADICSVIIAYPESRVNENK